MTTDELAKTFHARATKDDRKASLKGVAWDTDSNIAIVTVICPVLSQQDDGDYAPSDGEMHYAEVVGLPGGADELDVEGLFDALVELLGS